MNHLFDPSKFINDISELLTDLIIDKVFDNRTVTIMNLFNIKITNSKEQANWCSIICSTNDLRTYSVNSCERENRFMNNDLLYNYETKTLYKKVLDGLCQSLLISRYCGSCYKPEIVDAIINKISVISDLIIN